MGGEGDLEGTTMGVGNARMSLGEAPASARVSLPIRNVGFLLSHKVKRALKLKLALTPRGADKPDRASYTS